MAFELEPLSYSILLVLDSIEEYGKILDLFLYFLAQNVKLLHQISRLLLNPLHHLPLEFIQLILRLLKQLLLHILHCVQLPLQVFFFYRVDALVLFSVERVLVYNVVVIIVFVRVNCFLLWLETTLRSVHHFYFLCKEVFFLIFLFDYSLDMSTVLDSLAEIHHLVDLFRIPDVFKDYVSHRPFCFSIEFKELPLGSSRL